MFEITAAAHFDAAHFLREYNGKCANLHGHRWKVEVSIRGAELDKIGILVDFSDVKSFLKEAMNKFDHRLINDVNPFNNINPTAENIAKFIFDFMDEQVGAKYGERAKLHKVIVWETETSNAAYFKE